MKNKEIPIINDTGYDNFNPNGLSGEDVIRGMARWNAVSGNEPFEDTPLLGSTYDEVCSHDDIMKASL